MTGIQPMPSTSPFDGIRHEDEQGEWWSARELAEMLGYKPASWHNFETVLAKAKKACANSNNAISDHFYGIVKMVTLGSGAQRELPDYRLTRYACYLIAQNGDPRKNIVARAQTYFAVRTREAELDEVAAIEAQVTELAAQLQGDPLAEIAQRILLRQELTDANKALLQRAYEAEVITKRQLAMFMNMGYEGLYDERTEDDMHAMRGLRPNQKISDYMSALDTFANYLRVILGKRNMQTRQVGNPRATGVAHYDAGRQVRTIFLQLLGIAPEDLPRQTKSYQQIVREEYERIQREEEDARGLWAQLPAPSEPDEA